MTSLRIDAVIGETERPSFVAACERLRKCLSAASDSEWTIQSSIAKSVEDLKVAAPPSSILLSLLPDAERTEEPFDQTEARWRADLSSLARIPGAKVFLVTVFRHLPDRAGSRQSQRILERIRRLNRMATELSHDFETAVIDIDRIFAHIGARTVAADYRLGNGLAADVAAHAMVWSMLQGGLDDLIPHGVQEQAKKLHGDMRAIVKLIGRVGRGTNDTDSHGAD